MNVAIIVYLLLIWFPGIWSSTLFCKSFLPRSLLLLDFLFLITVALEHVVVYGEMSLSSFSVVFLKTIGCSISILSKKSIKMIPISFKEFQRKKGIEQEGLLHD